MKRSSIRRMMLRARYGAHPTGQPSSGSGCLWIVAALFVLMVIGLVTGPVR